MEEMFKVKAKSGEARTGVLQTEHGKILTPNMAVVATHGSIRFFDRTDHKRASPELLISNTFHLWVQKKVPEIKRAGGIHRWSKIKEPIMTDSGGFQVFSLGWGKVHSIGKISKGEDVEPITKQKSSLKISNDGVVFTYDGKEMELTPEKSMKIQKDIAADIIFSFDECTSPYHGRLYTQKSLKRTHDWAERSLKEFRNKNKNKGQQIFGIVQGGIYEDLRKKSSKFIGSLSFDGFGIGGSFGEREMGEAIDWALSGLPDEKPRHLLGVGRIKDILIAVERGMDLFDCVIPTREGRHGTVYTLEGKLDIRRGVFAEDKKKIDKGCDCYVCKKLATRKALCEFFKQSKEEAQKLAVIHNINFYKIFFKKLRLAIEKGKGLESIKKEYKNYI